ncbi:M48 family metallopeptidase [Amphritea balenae]|uniref:Peptidase M48 domain-containing protein n=1 Tax=Amphritea balenae TaxID=452629 RepID=A0A3P1SQ18_9GAMM|nr:M48 family metallopeptidase [Amphritea balenae]RRC99170.1 hypothetical protein EHS89_09955 [Amphritea balenae]GGK73345.1 Zn-dependent protease [Amphritea balenae]
MNFYTAQDRARKSSKLLLLLFLILNIALVVLINLLFAWYLWVNDDPLAMADRIFLDYLSWQRLFAVGAGIAVLLLFAAWLKWQDVKQGGGAVAELMGGDQILHSTSRDSERRLLNIVEEMSLAAGVPVPPVYVMRSEAGINAFAAGLGLKDAAICVTRGAIEGLSRDQLQGVIAHEFSHILNGDMRLNMRMIVILHGMIFFGELGRSFASSRTSWWVDGTKSKSSSRGSLVLLGLGLIIIGWCGVLLGNLIKAAVSRQREFLADASAVQFTRNPEGIADALKVIGGTRFMGYVNHPGSEEASHLFFSAVSPARWWSTHPPLEIRIRRIDPRWDGAYLEPVSAPVLPEIDQKPDQKIIDSLIGTLATAELLTEKDYLAGSAVPEDQALYCGTVLSDMARDPYDARILLLGLLLDSEPEIRSRQVAMIRQQDQTMVERLDRCDQHLAELPREEYLSLIELSLPALKTQSQTQYKAFKRLLIKVVRADQRIDLFEWVLYQLVSRFCDAHFGLLRIRENRYSDLSQLSAAYQIVLSTLAHYGSDDEVAADKAFNRGAGTTGLYNLRLLPEAECQRDAFSGAVSELSLATPYVKQRMLRGLIALVQHDGKVVAVERELLTAIAAVMESPLIGLDN